MSGCRGSTLGNLKRGRSALVPPVRAGGFCLPTLGHPTPGGEKLTGGPRCPAGATPPWGRLGSGQQAGQKKRP